MKTKLIFICCENMYEMENNSELKEINTVEYAKFYSRQNTFDKTQ